MAYYSKTKRVGEAPEVIEALEHDLSFASDSDINDLLVERYRLYDWLTPSDTANSMMLQSVIHQWHDYVEKLYETTQYEYDPISNYDRHEEGLETTEKHKGTRTASNVNVKTSAATDVETTDTPRVERVTDTDNYGLGSGTSGAPVQKVTENAPTGTDTSRTVGTAANNYNETIGNAANNYTDTTDVSADVFDKDVLGFTDRRTWGNIGVTTTQQMIQSERDIIIDVLQVYISKFAECFDISTDILFGWLEDEEGG